MNKDYVPRTWPVLYRLVILSLYCKLAVAWTAKNIEINMVFPRK